MVPMRRPVTHASIGTRTWQSPAFPPLSRHLHVLLLPYPVHPFEVHPPAAERIRAREYLMRALTPVSRERLNDLPHHTEQLAIAVYLPGTVTLRASVLAKHPTGRSF